MISAQGTASSFIACQQIDHFKIAHPYGSKKSHLNAIEPQSNPEIHFSSTMNLTWNALAPSTPPPMGFPQPLLATIAGKGTFGMPPDNLGAHHYWAEYFSPNTRGFTGSAQ